jgi:aminopeptidase N
VRKVAGAAAILDQQYERIKNPDRKAQFAFVRPALSADPAQRDAWFASLMDAANRRRESWVLEGLRYLHHPLRAAAAEKHLATSLLLVREIQRTGDIFFPKRWIDATLSGHRSAEAAAAVHDFLASELQYPQRLRWTVLTAVDEVSRAAQ